MTARLIKIKKTHEIISVTEHCVLPEEISDDPKGRVNPDLFLLSRTTQVVFTSQVVKNSQTFRDLQISINIIWKLKKKLSLF